MRALLRKARRETAGGVEEIKLCGNVECCCRLPVCRRVWDWGIFKRSVCVCRYIKSCGQSLLAGIALGPTGFGDSPYSVLLRLCGESLPSIWTRWWREGLLTQEECEAVDFWGGPAQGLVRQDL